MTEATVGSSETRVFPPELDRRYPVVVRGEGVWLEDAAGKRYLDAMSGGSMAATLGYGRTDLVEAARAQALRLSYVHNEVVTNPAQERLADELVSVAPEGFTRVHFVTGGSEANEAALRLARAYHVERGQPERWRVISPAQAYHGPTIGTLALTGRPGLQGPLGPYLPPFLHIPPATPRFDPTGEATLAALDSALEEAGPETVSAFFCEPISAAALPAFKPPDRFWEGLAERRERHGFLICFDEIVTGMGRSGNWFAANDLPFVPDVIAIAKGLGAGYAAIGAALCREPRLRGRCRRVRGASRSATPGTARRSPVPWGWPSSTPCVARGLSSMSASGERACGRSSRTRSPRSRSSARFGATASSSESNTATRERRVRSCPPSFGWRGAWTRSRSKTG